MPERHPLVGDRVQRRPRRGLFQREAEEARGVEAVHGGPAVCPVADVAGDALLAGDADEGRDEAVVPLTVNAAGSRTIDERTPWEERESANSAVSHRACGPPPKVAPAGVGVMPVLLGHHMPRCKPQSLAPLDAAAVGLEAAGAFIQEGDEHAHQRQAIIASSAELREREPIKLASLAAALAEALRQRDVEDPAASLTAEAGIAVFKVAFERYAEETSQQDLPRLTRESLDELKAVTASHSRRSASPVSKASRPA